MIDFNEIDYQSLTAISEDIARRKDLPKSISANLSVALNFSDKLDRRYRDLIISNSPEDIAAFAPDLPDYMNSIDAAKSLFVSLLGDVEDPFVYSIVVDYGGLKRVKIYDSIDMLHASADACTEAAAFTRAIIKTVLLLREKDTNDGKRD